MTNTYRITPRARQDLQKIGRYTLKMWGKEQRNAYLHAMEQRIIWLAENPDLGRHRPEIKKGYFSFPQGSHLIFYLKRDDGIDIIGVPHRMMDVTTHLSYD
jgi:toxin ParE1/3/4